MLARGELVREDLVALPHDHAGVLHEVLGCGGPGHVLLLVRGGGPPSWWLIVWKSLPLLALWWVVWPPLLRAWVRGVGVGHAES